MSVETKLIEVLQAKQTIKDAILAKNPTVQPSNILSAWGESIASIPDGKQFRNDEGVVDFVNFRGVPLYSYTKAQANALTALPPVPGTSGKIVGNRWNFTLAQMKNRLSKAGKCQVGAVYDTVDNQSWFYMDNLNGYTPTCRFKFYGKSGTNTRICATQGTTTNVLYDQTFAGTNSYVVKAVGVDYEWWNGLAMRVQVSSDFDESITMHYITGLSTDSATSQFTEQAGHYRYAYLGNNISSNLDYAVFRGCRRLTAVTLNSNLKSFGTGAFYGCGDLEHVTIPDGVSSIPSQAFYSCYKLKSVSIPDSVVDIGTSAFAYCHSLTGITLPNGLTAIKSGLFMGCRSLERINIPPNITTIGSEAFKDSGLQEANLSVAWSSLQTIGVSSFCYCRELSSIQIPRNVTTVGRYAFYNCPNLQRAECMTRYQDIVFGSNVFDSCINLISWSPSFWLSACPEDMFRNCRSMQLFSVPEDFKKIGPNAFYAMYACKYFDFTSVTSIPTLDNANAFTNTKSDTKIVVPDNLYTNWRKASKWNTLSSKIIKESNW